MILRLTTIACTAILALSLAGCDLDGQPRTLPAPDFDGRSAFPSLDDSAPSPRDRSTAGDDRIEALMEGDGAEETPTRSLQTIALGGSLVSELPDDFESWSWSRSEDVTIASYSPPGEPPAALILTRRSASTGLSRQMRRFQGDVDPSLGDAFDLGELLRAAHGGELSLDAAVDPDGDVDLIELLDILAGGNTLTGGRGIGYRSQRDTFSGWRWLGRTGEDVFVRLAATEGQWGPQPPTPPGLGLSNLQAILAGATEPDEDTIPLDLDEAFDQLRQISTDGEPPQPPAGLDVTSRIEPPSSPTGALATHHPRRARMLVGELDAAPTHRVHIAIVCVAEPHCPAAAELAEFLNRVRIAESPPSARQSDFDEHLEQLGLHLND